MSKVSKKLLKSSKRGEIEITKKIKTLTKQGKLEEGIEYFQEDKTNTDIVLSDLPLPNKNESKKNSKKSNLSTNSVQEEKKSKKKTKISDLNDNPVKENCLMEIDPVTTISTESQINCAVILNLPIDTNTEECNNFLSKRGIPVDGLRINSGNYALIESNDEEILGKIRTAIASNPLPNCDDMKASQLSGNAAKFTSLFQNNIILNKNIVLVKNINKSSKIEDIISLIPKSIKLKKQNSVMVRNRQVKTQLLTLEFVSPKETDIVIEKLNGVMIDGNQLVAVFKQKMVEDSVLENKSTTLLLKDLPDTTDYQTIKDLELPCTKIELVKKSAKRMCFLKFATVKEAMEAHEILLDKEINGVKILMKFLDMKNENADNEDIDNTKLHITNLPFNSTKEDMEKEFDMAESIKFPLNPSGKSKGCCYLSFASAELAALAMEAFKEKMINGRKIRCAFGRKSIMNQINESSFKPPRKNAEKLKNNVLTLFNLPLNVTKDQIISKFHHVKFINFVKKGEKFVGIAEVHFKSSAAAKEAVEQAEFSLNNRVIRKELRGGQWRAGTVKKKNFEKQNISKKE